MRGWVSRAIVASGAALIATVAPSACSEQKGGLMLAVNTDMQVPKDVSLISVTVFTNDAVKFNTLGRVRPDGSVELPSTLAIAEPDDANATVRVRVMAFQDQKPRVLRDIRTTVPHKGRIAYLRVPLNFLDDKSGTGEIPIAQLPPGGTSEFDPTPFVTTCPDPLQTSIDGICKDPTIDSSTLPDWDPSLAPSEDQGCFDPSACLAGAKEVDAADLDLTTCTVSTAGKDPAKLNFAFKNADTGLCVKPGECYVPLEQSEHGWLPGDRLKLTPGACSKYLSKGVVKLAISTACAPWDPKLPVCRTVTTPPGGPDAGADANAVDAGAVDPNYDGVGTATSLITPIQSTVPTAAIGSVLYWLQTNAASPTATVVGVDVTKPSFSPLFLTWNGVTPNGVPRLGRAELGGPQYGVVQDNSAQFAGIVIDANRVVTPYGGHYGPRAPVTIPGQGPIYIDPNMAWIGNAGFVGGFVSPMPGQTVIGAPYGNTPRTLLLGDDGGNVGLCTTGAFGQTTISCIFGKIGEAGSVQSQKVVGLVAQPSTGLVFAANEDGVYVLQDTGGALSAKRLTTERFVEIDTNASYPDVGQVPLLQANDKCVFYTTGRTVGWANAAGQGGIISAIRPIAEANFRSVVLPDPVKGPLFFSLSPYPSRQAMAPYNAMEGLYLAELPPVCGGPPFGAVSATLKTTCKLNGRKCANDADCCIGTCGQPDGVCAPL